MAEHEIQPARSPRSGPTGSPKLTPVPLTVGVKGPHATSPRLHPAGDLLSGADGGLDSGQSLSKAQLRALRREKQERERAGKVARKGKTGTDSDERSKPTTGSYQSHVAKADGGAAQRSAHPAHAGAHVGAHGAVHRITNPALQYDDARRMAKKKKKDPVLRTALPASKQFEFLSHLPQYELESSLSLNVGFSARELHPAAITAGLRMADGVVAGANARTAEMLYALRAMVLDPGTYVSDSTSGRERTVRETLNTKLATAITFLEACRPLSIPMRSTLRTLKDEIFALAPEISPSEAAAELSETIDHFVQERIVLAQDVMARVGSEKLESGDMVLTYGWSPAVEAILMHAIGIGGKRLHVVVCDGRPGTEGKDMVRRLGKWAKERERARVAEVSIPASRQNSQKAEVVPPDQTNDSGTDVGSDGGVCHSASPRGPPAAGDGARLDPETKASGEAASSKPALGPLKIAEGAAGPGTGDAPVSPYLLPALPSAMQTSDLQLTYIRASAASYLMRDVSLVLLGASAMFGNSTCLAPCGTAALALLGKMHKKPVLVCAATYEFSEQAQYNAFGFNELGDPGLLVVEDDVEPCVDSLKDWKEIDALRLLNLKYDLTPAEFIDAVVTELGVLPPSSVPVVLREYGKEL